MKKLTLLLLAVICSLSIWAEPQHGSIYVKPGATGDGSSWGNALGDIQTAINKARDNGERTQRKDVWVAAGEYAITAPISMQDSVNVYGSFAGTETTLEQRAKVANGKAWEFANPSVIKADGVILAVNFGAFDIPTVMDGFTITDGGASGVSLRPNGILQNCIVKNCTYSAGGGGGITMYLGGNVISCLVKDNTQTSNGNGGGGIFCNTSSAATLDVYIEGCEITGNTSTIRGAGLGIQGASATIYVNNCKIYNNRAIDGTTSKQGGGIFCNSQLNEITNCLVYNNTGTNAIQLQSKKFVNNTVVKNIGGIYIASGAITSEIKNNIIWACVTDATLETATSLTGVAVTGMPAQNNATYNPLPAEKGWLTTVDEVESNILFSSNVSNGDIENPNEGTVGSGPKFAKVTTFIGAIDPAMPEEDRNLLLQEFVDADWSLNRVSPCVNAGQNLDYLSADIIGENRPQGFPFDEAKTDIGAYEYPYYVVSIAPYDATKGNVCDSYGIELPAGSELGYAKGEEIELNFMPVSGELPFKVTITRSNNGGLTFDGDVIDITGELDTDFGSWTSNVSFPFQVKVEWDNLSFTPNIDSENIRCYAIDKSIQIEGLSSGECVNVYHASGALVAKTTSQSNVLSIPVQSGTYIVRIGNAAYKIAVK